MENQSKTPKTVRKTIKEGKDKNLTPFKSGKAWNGNKNGRPKGTRNLTTLFKEAFDKIKQRAKEEKGIDIEDPEIDIIIALIGGAKKGVPKLVDTYMKYKYGQPKQEIELSGELETKLSPDEQARVDAIVSRWNK